MSRSPSSSHDETMCSLSALAGGCHPRAPAHGPALGQPAAPAPPPAKLPFSWCCWCCCCSCSSCVAARGAEGARRGGGAGGGRRGGRRGGRGAPPSPIDPLRPDHEPPPSLEDIQSWGHSFDRLMRSAAGRAVFRDFLRGEYSEENIMFWLACEELRREQDPAAVEEKARFIYEDYISILSPKEVSLDSRVREIVNRNMVEPTPHTFDEAQLQIYTLMHRDSYPRFVNSQLYKSLARVADMEPAATSAPAPAPPPPPQATATAH